eukprot:CAMPEP_0194268672 /NCGR_PEP_ID=MMETSP0169-20130528/2950_1 /TAXON_ID=218684 /ORGANISM="Corethron pennatum, Strain L29A3" /LENGTH=63 /DNA_ID=CAMNT_0039009983 /DNA_START=89 /DNA_END=277 /DNA_ORIENTATION=+
MEMDDSSEEFALTTSSQDAEGLMREDSVNGHIEAQVDEILSSNLGELGRAKSPLSRQQRTSYK